MSTALDVITDGLETLGVYAAGESISGADVSRCMVILNDMLDSWSNEALTCFAISEQSFPVVVGQSQYTIGPGGNINTIRPIRVLAGPGTAYLLDTNNNRYPVRVVPQDQWNLIWNLTSVTSNLPDTLFYDPQFPLGIINIFPSPNTGGMTIFFDSYLTLTSFPDLSTDITFPPGYRLAVVKNFAVAAKPYFTSGPLDPDLMRQALESKANIKRSNMRENVALYDAELSRSQGRPYNIYSDSNR